MDKKEIQPKDPNWLRKQAEEKVQPEKLQELVGFLNVEEGRKLLHELRVHQVELEMQNEELRRSQLEIETARAKYFDLYDLAPVGYVTISDKGIVLEANLTAAHLLGMTKNSMLDQPFTRFICPADQDIYYLHRKQLFETGATQVCELQMLCMDKSLFWARIEATASNDAIGVSRCRAVISDITHQKLADGKIKKLLNEKELLLKEVHHRIKNNMNTMASLLSLQLFLMKDPAAIAVLQDAQSRLQSMGILYNKLYRSENLQEMSIRDYLPFLVEEIVNVFPNSSLVEVKTNIADFMLNIDILSTLGIIINELITNIMKFAFTGKNSGLVTLSASLEVNHVTIIVEDNGNGMPASVDIEKPDGFGLELVGMLTQQIDGTIRIEREKGTRFILEFDR